MNAVFPWVGYSGAVARRESRPGSASGVAMTGLEQSSIGPGFQPDFDSDGLASAMHKCWDVPRLGRILLNSATLATLVATALASCVADPVAVWVEGDEPQGGKADGAWRSRFAAYGPLPEAASLEAPLAALFAPDDPVVTLEVELIDRIRAARREDPTLYVEGQNPYRIRYAVYNLRNKDVVMRLADAADEGVDVQILIEADQLDPGREYNDTDEYLAKARHFELIRDHVGLDKETRATADLVGISGKGLMHLKTRIFEAPRFGDRPAFRAVLSGSLNPGDEAVGNDETLHLIRDERLIERYAKMYDAVLSGTKVTNVWDQGAATNVLFAPAEGLQAGATLLRWVEEENEQVLLMVFSLRNLRARGISRSLVKILEQKVRTGVPVWVITDRKQADSVDAQLYPLPKSSDDPTEDDLRRVGVHVYEALNLSSAYTAMHHKVGILGRTRIRVITDAGNWTRAALGDGSVPAENHESLLFIDTQALDQGGTGRRYLSAFGRVLSKYAHQTPSEPSFADAWAQLVALPGWPSQELDFAAEVSTTFGESVWIRGDVAALGGWSAPGLPLSTNAATYPVWASAPIVLPVGQPFTWKLAAGATNDHVRWESGPDRTDRAAPLPLVPDHDVVHLRGTWRYPTPPQ